MMYVNSAGGSREGAMFIAYVLSTRYGINQAAIGEMFEVSQAAISSWIKEVKYELQIRDLTAQLAQAQSDIESRHLVIPSNSQTYLPSKNRPKNRL